nr:unnamed protein product [Callosobruchus analis]
MQYSLLEETGESNMPSPHTYFESYISDDLLQMAADQADVYSLSKTGTNVNTTPDEMKHLFSIHILMAILKYYQLRLYWNSLLAILGILDLMSRNRLWEVRPLLDAVRNRCAALDLEENLCVFEQMTPFKGTLT